MYSIQWDVVLLRRQGQRLRRGELEPATRGLIEIGERADTTFRRAVRVAELLNPVTRLQSRQSVLLPLFDPVVLQVDGAGVMSITGIELHAHGGRVAEHQQVWRCAPVVVE